VQQKLTLALLLAASALFASMVTQGDVGPVSFGVHVGKEGYIACFDVNGPFPSKLSARLFDSSFNPGDLPLELEKVGRLFPRETQLRSTPGMVFKSPRFKTVVLRATLRSERAGKYLLTAGTDGPIRIFLNNRLIHGFDGERRARPDTDLISLRLATGDNHIVIAVSNLKKRQWRAYFRLLKDDFSAADDLAIHLDGSGAFHSPLSETGTLKLKRSVDLGSRSVTVTPILRFRGGRPIEGPLKCRVSFVLGGESLPELGESTVLPKSAAPEIRFGAYRFDGDPVPEQLSVDCNGAQFSKKLGFLLQHVRELAAASDGMARAVSAAAKLESSTAESLYWRLSHLTERVASGDGDYLYLTKEIRNTGRMVAALERGEDPYWDRRHQVQRRGYRSSLDGKYHPYVLYVPPLWRENDTRSFGLVVMLHGLNAHPMKAMQSIFGRPLEEGEIGAVRARHPLPVDPAPFFVLAPEGFGPSGYRQFGERDVIDVLDIVTRRYRINPDRIYITGSSMGGIGATALPLHYPSRFAAMAPLGGYHSMFVYRQIRETPLAPWERFLLQTRSNADWAANGRHLPLYVVHGLKDTPMHSRVLVSAYAERGYPVKMETPDLGHNVWDQTYQGGAIFTHFRKYKRNAHPKQVTFTTSRLRYRDAYWVTIDDVDDFAEWATVDADWKRTGEIAIKTRNIKAMTLQNDEVLRAHPVSTIVVDGAAVPVSPEATKWPLVRSVGGWRLDTAGYVSDGIRKRPGLAGPIDDAYFEPLLFVYSDDDAAEERLTRRLAHTLRKPSRGVTVEWPVKRASEVTAADIETRSLVIIGTPSHNSLLRRIGASLPIRVEGDTIAVGDERFGGSAPAAAFIYPNPINPDRYVVVYTATSLEGLFYTDHLPQTAPDYIVFDGPTWRRKGGRPLIDRPVLTAGFFDKNWNVKGEIQNPYRAAMPKKMRKGSCAMLSIPSASWTSGFEQ
jgi:poly(3-hydroxybutyrate) depolymerase